MKKTTTTREDDDLRYVLSECYRNVARTREDDDSRYVLRIFRDLGYISCREIGK